jgi:hypothetical protein
MTKDRDALLALTVTSLLLLHPVGQAVFHGCLGRAAVRGPLAGASGPVALDFDLLLVLDGTSTPLGTG